MIHRLFIILSAIFFLLLPSRGDAQSYISPLCQEIGARMNQGNHNPVSNHYIKKVLDRAKNALNRIRSAEATPDFSTYSTSKLAEIQSRWASLIDVEQTMKLEEKELRSMSACLFSDLLLLDCTIDEARAEMRNQIAVGSNDGITQLQDLLSFLNERRYHLAQGSLNPDYEDATWHVQYSFDGLDENTTAWCCPQDEESSDVLSCIQQSADACNGQLFYSQYGCVEAGCKEASVMDAPNEVLCPFDSDYASASINGYGCDLTVFERIHNGTQFDYMPLYAEEYATFRMSLETEEFRESALELLDIQEKLNALFGRESKFPTERNNDEHKRAYGCSWEGGVCSNNEDMRCLKDADCESDGSNAANVTCEIPEKVCANNTIIRCKEKEDCERLFGVADQQTGNRQPNTPDIDCIDIEETDQPPLRSLRSPFSLGKDEVRILSDFLGERVAEGIARELTREIRYPEEFSDAERTENPPNDATDDAWWSKIMSPIVRLFVQPKRNAVEDWNKAQGLNEAISFPKVADPVLQTAESLSVLRKAVSTLAKMSSEKDGLRSFVKAYAYFMHRTCIYRPCSLLLEQVIRIANADKCFPYTTGEFIGKEEIWNDCKDEAEIN